MDAMKKIFLKAGSCLLLFIYTLSLFFNNKIYASAADNNMIKCYTGVSIESISHSNGECRAAVADDVRVSSRIWELFFGKDKNKNEEILLYPGGSIFGLHINEVGVTVTSGSESKVLRPGDRILSVNGARITSPVDVESAVKGCGGKKMSFEIIRQGERITVSVIPSLTDGEYRLGVRLRGETAGIGTVTYIEPETLAFGGLGHGVCDGESGEYITIQSASVNKVALGGCRRGEAGKAGELTGVLKRDEFGFITGNCECGVFGGLDSLPDYCDEPLPAGHKDELKCGPAEIISTVKNGYRTKYDIEIYDIDVTSTGSKSFKIRVTDPALIAITGGIVRGMSGSPIIQDGKLVGAVTHVMLNDPTLGYGIFIENMLSAAEGQAQPKAA